MLEAKQIDICLWPKKPYRVYFVSENWHMDKARVFDPRRQMEKDWGPLKYFTYFSAN